jgi:hypothetical protein
MMRMLAHPEILLDVQDASQPLWEFGIPPTARAGKRRDTGHEGDRQRDLQLVDCVGMVHFVRNALALVPKSAAQMVAATIRTVFVQPDAATAREH